MPRKTPPATPAAPPDATGFDLANLQRLPLDSLVPDPENPRRGDVEAIMASFRLYGQDQPLVVQSSTRKIIKGNHRHEAALRLGWSEMWAYLVDDDEAKARGRGLADNRIADRAYFDEKALAALLKQVELPTEIPGFDEEYVQRVLDSALLADLPPRTPGSEDPSWKGSTPDADGEEEDHEPHGGDETVTLQLVLLPAQRDRLFETVNDLKATDPEVMTTVDALMKLVECYEERREDR